MFSPSDKIASGQKCVTESVMHDLNSLENNKSEGMEKNSKREASENKKQSELSTNKLGMQQNLNKCFKNVTSIHGQVLQSKKCLETNVDNAHVT